MNLRPVSVTQDGAEACAVYVADDVVCVGRIEMGLRESLRRVAYRDVARMVVWEARRQHVRALAWMLLAAFVGAGLLALTAGGEEVALVLVLVGALPWGLLMWRGRLGAVTRFRLEAARTTVEGVLAGAQPKRARILAEIERRVRERQAAPLPT